MPSGPIIVFGEIRAVTSRPTTSKVCRVISHVQRSASPTAATGPNFLRTVFGAMPIFGPAPESLGVIARSNACPSRQTRNVIGPPARGAHDRRDLGEGAQRLAVDREDRVVGAQARGLGGLAGQDLAHADEGVNADRADLLGGGGLGAHGDVALLGPAADAQREGRLGAQEDVVLRLLPRRERLAVDRDDLVSGHEAGLLRRRARARPRPRSGGRSGSPRPRSPPCRSR